MIEKSVIIQVEIDFEHGKETIEMVMKQSNEIADCNEGLIVSLNLHDDQTYTGIFEGMDDDETLMLRSIQGGQILGFKTSWIKHYFEQVTFSCETKS